MAQCRGGGLLDYDCRRSTRRGSRFVRLPVHSNDPNHHGRCHAFRFLTCVRVRRKPSLPSVLIPLSENIAVDREARAAREEARAAAPESPIWLLATSSDWSAVRPTKAAAKAEAPVLPRSLHFKSSHFSEIRVGRCAAKIRPRERGPLPRAL